MKPKCWFEINHVFEEQRVKRISVLAVLLSVEDGKVC